MTNPTPCEHEWEEIPDEEVSFVRCRKCKEFEKPTPEEKCEHCWHVVETSTDIRPIPKKKCGEFPNVGYDDGCMELCCRCGIDKEEIK